MVLVSGSGASLQFFSAAYRAQRPFAHETADALSLVSRMSILLQLYFPFFFNSQPPVRSLLAAASMLLPEACRARTTADLSNPKPCDRRTEIDLQMTSPVWSHTKYIYVFYSGRTFATHHQGADCVFRRGAHQWLPQSCLSLATRLHNAAVSRTADTSEYIHFAHECSLGCVSVPHLCAPPPWDQLLTAVGVTVLGFN